VIYVGGDAEDFAIVIGAGGEEDDAFIVGVDVFDVSSGFSTWLTLDAAGILNNNFVIGIEICCMVKILIVYPFDTVFVGDSNELVALNV